MSKSTEQFKKELASIINRSRYGAICDVTEGLDWEREKCLDGDVAVEELLKLFNRYKHRTFEVKIRDANGCSFHYALTLDSETVLRGPESEVTIREES